MFNPAWFALESSRGIESPESKLFMRATVLLCDVLVYMPAVALFLHAYLPQKTHPSKAAYILIVLMQPALILIDHGHFQYNAVMLGTAVLALVALQQAHRLGSIAYLVASVMYCLSLMFKQMALYYSLAMFAYLLGKCLAQPSTMRAIGLFIRLGATVVLTFALCLLPWITSIANLQQLFVRLFPVHRGLYEDKVANIWCAVNVLIKLRQLFEQQTLLYLSALCTIGACVPACVLLIRQSFLKVSTTKDMRGLLYGLSSASLAFYLFSFQVHEKSILIPLLPITLLIKDEPWLVISVTNVATFSMFPLLKRDGQTLPYYATLILWNWMVHRLPMRTPKPFAMMIRAYNVAMVSIQLAGALLTPPKRYPDLWTVLNVTLSASAFGLVYLYLVYRHYALLFTTTTRQKQQ